MWEFKRIHIDNELKMSYNNVKMIKNRSNKELKTTINADSVYIYRKERYNKDIATNR